MCTYITTLLPAGADVARVRAIAKEHRLDWAEHGNAHLEAQVKHGETWYLTNPKHCDCGTALGSIDESDIAHAEDPHAEVPSLRKRGWSETKIERWLGQKIEADRRRQRIRVSRRDDIERSPDATFWVAFFKAALVSGATDYVGVLVHWYKGPVTGEKITIVRREPIAYGDVTARRLCALENDVLYEVRSTDSEEIRR